MHSVLLIVTELSDLQPIWLQRYFSELAQGTVAAGARLDVESDAPEFRCSMCGADFALSLRSVDRVTCPGCGSSECTLVRKPDYVVEEIEVS